MPTVPTSADTSARYASTHLAVTGANVWMDSMLMVDTATVSTDFVVCLPLNFPLPTNLLVGYERTAKVCVGLIS